MFMQPRLLAVTNRIASAAIPCRPDGNISRLSEASQVTSLERAKAVLFRAVNNVWYTVRDPESFRFHVINPRLVVGAGS